MTAKTALQKMPTLAAATAKELGLTDSYVQLIKDVYAKDASDAEFAFFLRTAHRLRLDITARQIFLIKRWDGSLRRNVATPQTSIDGLRAIADRTDKYVPGRETVYAYTEDGALVSATAFVKKFVGGEWHETSAQAFYNEYVQKKQDGEPNSSWAKMPHVMLGKCAEALALRKAFPAEMSGIYTVDEMGSDLTENAEAALSPRRSLRVAEPNNAETIDGNVVDAEPVEEADTENEYKAIQLTCKVLNDLGDSIIWTAKELNEYAMQLFDDDSIQIEALTPEQTTFLLEDLQERVRMIEAEVAERQRGTAA